MKILTEKRAENFLKKQGFNVINTAFAKKESEIKTVLKKFRFPVVMKISSKKIIHKTKIKGVKLGIKNYNEALKAFNELKKIRGFEGVLIQEQVKGREFLVGLKKTNDFGFVVGFGKGGSKAEKLKDIEFRVCNVKGFDELSENKNVKKILIKLCKLSEKYPEIDSLDINPLIVNKKQAVIVDSQVFFE